MRRMMVMAAVLATTISAGSASAGIYTDDFGKCLVASSSAEDKTALMQWMFSAFSVNPAIKSMTSVTAEQRDGYNRRGAEVMQRLIISDCRKQAVEAMKYEGSAAMQGGFEVLGQVAARGLMSEPASQAELQKFATYFDMQKLNALGEEVGGPKPAPSK